MNLADPELELVDPTPNVHTLFLHFDKIFFWTKLASRAVVRWSKRMYSCAGICSYDRGGLCDIALSEPLLKLRPRKDLIETLLHEMIHAYLFITNRDRDRDGHGPNFKAHMHRINNAAGLNISIYHDFHEEVKLYQTHWWRCNGICQSRKPHFGIVRRSMNRAPGPSDYWWDSHKSHCGGTFVKIKEPEKQQMKKPTPKPSADITKYVNKTNKDKGRESVSKPILKDSNNLPIKSNMYTKSNNSSTIVVTKKNNIIFNPKAAKPAIFSGQGNAISGRSRTNSASGVIETVRNVWANKQLSMTFSNTKTSKEVTKVTINTTNLNKHKADEHSSSPPTKIKKIDEYFKSNAKSVLKDLYGQDFDITEVNSNKRLSVVPVKLDLVDCPVCSSKVSDSEINGHLDECLNKKVIETICKDNDNTNPVIFIKTDHDKVNNNVSNAKSTNVKNKPIKIENVPLRFSNIKTESTDIIDVSNNRTLIKSPENDADKFKISKINPDTKAPKIKIEPGCSKDADTSNEQNCPCCGEIITKAVQEHLEECLAFFDNNDSIPIEGASTSFNNETIVIDDEDDICDESLTLNATGTKSPCPCCLKMIELVDMNDHLDICLS